MTVERALRGAAGALVLISLALAQLHSVYWLALTGVVGLNLLQSMFTDWCPMKSCLRACGLKSAEERIIRPA
jgi:hypothetical protein